MSELDPKVAIELHFSEGAPSATAKSAAVATQSFEPQPRLFHRAAQVIQRTQLKLESDLQEYQAACASFFASKNNYSNDDSRKMKNFSGRKKRRLARVGGNEQGQSHSELYEEEEEEEEEDYRRGTVRRGGLMGGDASDEDIASTTSDGSRRSFHSNTLSGFTSSCYTRGSSRRQSAARGGPRTSDGLAYDDEEEDHIAASDNQRAAASRSSIDSGAKRGEHRQRGYSVTSSHFDSEARARYRDRQLERIMTMGVGVGSTSDCCGEDSYGTYDTYDEDDDDVGSVRHADFSAEEEVEGRVGGAEGRASSPTAVEGAAVLSPRSTSSPLRQSLKKGTSTRLKSEDDALSSNSKRSRGRRRKGRTGGYRRDDEHDGGDGQHDSTSMPMTKGPIVGYLRVPRQEALLLQQLRISARANFVEAARREQQMQLQREIQQHHHQKEEKKDSLGATEVGLGRLEPPLTAPLATFGRTTHTTTSPQIEPTGTPASTPPLASRSIGSSNPPSALAGVNNNNNSNNSGPNSNAGSSYAIGLDNVQLVRVVKAKKRLNDCLSAVGKYSTLCDQLGLRLITFDDVADILLKKCMAVLDPMTVTTDGSCVFYIEGRYMVEAMASMMDTLRRKKAANSDMVSAAEGRLFRTEGISSQQATPAKGSVGIGIGCNSSREETKEEVLYAAEEAKKNGEVQSSMTPSLPPSAELNGLPASEGAAITGASQANGECKSEVARSTATATSTDLTTNRNEKDVSKEKRDKKGEKKKGGFFSNLFKKQEETHKRQKKGKNDEYQTTGEEAVLGKDRKEAKYADPAEQLCMETRINAECGKSSKEEKEEATSSPQQTKTSDSSACKEPRFSTQGLTPTELQGVHTAVVRAMLFLIETRVVGLVHSSEYQQPQPQVQVKQSAEACNQNGESECISRQAETGDTTHKDLEPTESSEPTASATNEKKETELLPQSSASPHISTTGATASANTTDTNMNDGGASRLAGQWSPDRFSFIVCLDGIGDHGKLVPLFLLMKRMLADAYPMRVCGIYLLYSHQRHIEWFLQTRHKMSASAAKSYLAKFSAHAGATGSGGKNAEKEADNQQSKKRGGEGEHQHHHHQSTINGYVPPPLVGISNKVRFYIALQALKVQLLTVKLMRRLHTADDLFGVVDIESLDTALRSANMKGFLPPPPTSA